MTTTLESTAYIINARLSRYETDISEKVSTNQKNVKSPLINIVTNTWVSISTVGSIHAVLRWLSNSIAFSLPNSIQITDSKRPMVMRNIQYIASGSTIYIYPVVIRVYNRMTNSEKRAGKRYVLLLSLPR
jgi:hypothetical protein